MTDDRGPFVYVKPFPLNMGTAGQLPIPGQIALLVIHHDRASERYLLVCEHGVTAVEGVTGTAEDVEQLVAMLYDKHHLHWDCPCRQSSLNTMVDEWGSLKMAQEVFTEDALNPVPETSHYRGQERQMQENARRLNKLGCTRCKPGAQVMVHKGWYGARIQHAEDCPDPVLREVRFVDRDDPELWATASILNPWTILDGQRRVQ